jgi:hypothetical protein
MTGETANFLRRWALRVVITVAAGLLVIALVLPWFHVTFPGQPNGPKPYSVSWASWTNTSINVLDDLVPLGAVLSIGLAIAGLIWRRRLIGIATVAGFGTATVGALWTYYHMDSYFYAPISSATAGAGMVLFGVAGAIGAALALVQLIQVPNSSATHAGTER